MYGNRSTGKKLDGGVEYMIIYWQNYNDDRTFLPFEDGYTDNWVDTDFLKKESASITRIVSLSAGDKIKMRGRMIQGLYGQTAAHTVRLRIKKLFS